MILEDILSRFVTTPRLTPARMWLALFVAVAADGIQIMLGPLGWTFADEIIDVIAMIAVSWLVGFHLLLLPTFAVEFIPVVDMLPTWTTCVVAVIALRKREQRKQGITPIAPPVMAPPVIGQAGKGPAERQIDV